jgi:sodium/bile acid cotransporter 7
VIVSLLPFHSILSESLQTGFYFLAILPTTVASAITFTALAGGARANAVFSTVFSNLLAVLVVPALTVAYLATDTSVSVSVLPIFVKLLGLIVFPLVLGQMLSVQFLSNASKYQDAAKSLSQGIILFIVYTAFAESVQSGFLGELSWTEIVSVVVITLTLLSGVSLLVWWGSRWLQVTHAQRVAVFFCASQKSLATGLPLAAMILASMPAGLDSAGLLIPLMCYHPAQLFLAGFVSGRWASNAARTL